MLLNKQPDFHLSDFKNSLAKGFLSKEVCLRNMMTLAKRFEKIGEKPSDFKEIRTLSEVQPKIYSKGVVEAQADLDKLGDYSLILAIGGDEAISEEDRLKINFHVGESSILSKLSENMQIAIAGGIPALIAFIFGIFYFRKKRKTQ